MNEANQRITEKLRAIAQKRREEDARARVWDVEHVGDDSEISHASSRPLRKLLKKAFSIVEQITEQDVQKSMEVIRDAKNATRHYWDGKAQAMVVEPDHKTRLAAVTLERAYHEGLPVARAINANKDFESTEDTLARLKASPVAMEAITRLQSAGVKIRLGEEFIVVEEDVQKTSSKPPE